MISGSGEALIFEQSFGISPVLLGCMMLLGVDAQHTCDP
jgi:hypothetical protein